MEQIAHQLNESVSPFKPSISRRRTARIAKRFPLTVSYVDGAMFCMDDAEVTNLSVAGVGMRAQHPLKPGTTVALFIEQPDQDDDWCISTARVTWARGRHFGVALEALRQDDQVKLKSLYAVERRRASV